MSTQTAHDPGWTKVREIEDHYGAPLEFYATPGRVQGWVGDPQFAVSAPSLTALVDLIHSRIPKEN